MGIYLAVVEEVEMKSPHEKWGDRLKQLCCRVRSCLFVCYCFLPNNILLKFNNRIILKTETFEIGILSEKKNYNKNKHYELKVNLSYTKIIHKFKKLFVLLFFIDFL